MLRIIGVAESSCTQRVLATLAEKNVTDYTLETVDMKTGAHKQPSHLEKQPFGQIPVLEDGEVRIYESRAICRYIAAKYRDQGTPLVPDPSDLKAVGLFEQWASVEQNQWDPSVNTLVVQQLYNVMKGVQPVKEIVDAARETLKAKLAVFDVILGSQKYMGGDEFSLVDIFYYPWTQKLFQVGEGPMVEAHLNVKAWWERVSSRDSWKSTLAYGTTRQ